MFVIFVSGNVVALSPLSPQSCSIEGVIESAEFRTADCSGPEGLQICWNDEYRLRLKMEKSSVGENPFPDQELCEKDYPIGSVEAFRLEKSKVKEGDVFQPGLKIKGQTDRGFGTSFESYTLESKENPQQELKEGFLKKNGITIIGLLIIIAGVIFLVVKLKKK